MLFRLLLRPSSDAVLLLLLLLLLASTSFAGSSSEEDAVRGVRRLLLSPLASERLVCNASKMIGGKQYPKRVCLGRLRAPGGCNVIAVGSRKISHMKFDFDMQRKRGCRVASFDPFVTFTDQRESELAPGLTFYKVGLSSKKTLTAPLMDTLDGLVEEAGMNGQIIDVLKIDCEGCEWGAFEEIFQSNSKVLSFVNQLCIELHFEDQKPEAFTFGRFEAFLRLLDKYRFCPYYREGHSCPMKWPQCSPENTFFKERFRNESFIHHPARPLIRSWFELAWVKLDANEHCPFRHW